MLLFFLFFDDDVFVVVVDVDDDGDDDEDFDNGDDDQDVALEVIAMILKKIERNSQTNYLMIGMLAPFANSSRTSWP